MKLKLTNILSEAFETDAPWRHWQTIPVHKLNKMIVNKLEGEDLENYTRLERQYFESVGRGFRNVARSQILDMARFYRESDPELASMMKGLMYHDVLPLPPGPKRRDSEN